MLLPDQTRTFFFGSRSGEHSCWWALKPLSNLASHSAKCCYCHERTGWIWWSSCSSIPTTTHQRAAPSRNGPYMYTID